MERAFSDTRYKGIRPNARAPEAHITGLPSINASAERGFFGSLGDKVYDVLCGPMEARPKRNLGSAELAESD